MKSAQLLRASLVSKREQTVLWKEVNVYSIPPRVQCCGALPGKDWELVLPKNHFSKRYNLRAHSTLEQCFLETDIQLSSQNHESITYYSHLLFHPEIFGVTSGMDADSTWVVQSSDIFIPYMDIVPYLILLKSMESHRDLPWTIYLTSPSLGFLICTVDWDLHQYAPHLTNESKN